MLYKLEYVIDTESDDLSADVIRQLAHNFGRGIQTTLQGTVRDPIDKDRTEVHFKTFAVEVHEWKQLGV